MADAPYTQRRSFQFRGPTDSSDYNERIEENYKDVVSLYNRERLLEADSQEVNRRATKELNSLKIKVSSLESRVQTLEQSSNRIHFSSDDQIDNDRFDSTGFEVASTDELNLDTLHGVLTLPLVDTSSLSKLYVTNSDSVDVLPATLETRFVPDQTSADSSIAMIDTSDPALAIVSQVGRIWERNVVASSPNVLGAKGTLYVKIPTDLFTTDKSNVLIFHPYPVFGVNVTEIATTNVTDVLMQDSDGYTAINANALYNGNTDAVGWVPPGGWSGDNYTNASHKAYYFDPKLVTGLRIKISQPHYYLENGKYIYSYGLSKLDLRYNKFLGMGKALLKFEAPGSDTISSVNDVEPELWNVPEAAITDVFSYRVIWETALNSGVYTVTPVALSKRVWIEVTLNMTIAGGTPALSGLNISYA